MSDGWTREKEKTAPRKRNEWLIDLGLACIYSLFIMGCFFTLMRYRNNVILLAVLSSLSLACFCISYVLYDLERTLRILFFASFLVIVLSFALALYSEEIFWISILFSAFYLLVPSILGVIAGDYVAEKRKW
jgi:hypothetical protein